MRAGPLLSTEEQTERASRSCIQISKLGAQMVLDSSPWSPATG